MLCKGLGFLNCESCLCFRVCFISMSRVAIADSKKFKPAESKKLAKLVIDIESALTEISEACQECISEKFREHVPPNLAPKLRVAIASLQEQSVALNNMKADDWEGDAKESLDAVSAALAAATAVHTKAKKILKSAETD